MFAKVIYVTNESLEVVLSLAGDVVPKPEVKSTRWVNFEVDTGRVYVWDGAQWALKVDPVGKVLA